MIFDETTGLPSTVMMNGSDNGTSTLALIIRIEDAVSMYLYPCLIEYSLISLAVFLIMWRSIGKREEGDYIRFGERHIFTINCSRASRGLLIGGIIVLSTILTLVPIYLLRSDAHTITQITEVVLLSVALVFVCFGFFHTTKLRYFAHAHVDVFDQALIIIATVGDFSYTLFGLFASLLIGRENKLPGEGSVNMEIAIGFLAIIQTFLQSGFILDALKRRLITKDEIRNKPGRESVTALLLINLCE